MITSIDIQSVEPVDQRTRDSLQKSVQLAIEITTNSQEAAARHEAERLEQEAKGNIKCILSLCYKLLIYLWMVVVQLKYLQCMTTLRNKTYFFIKTHIL